MELVFDLLKVESPNALLLQFGVKELEEQLSLKCRIKGGCGFYYGDARTEEELFTWKAL